MTDLEAHWEAILASEGLAEVSLFDNTGKNAHAVTFISTTVDKSGMTEEYDASWEELANTQRFGLPLAIAELSDAIYWRSLTGDIAALPPGWPALERHLLDLYAESGNFEQSRRALDIDKTFAYQAKRRFEAWRKNTKSSTSTRSEKNTTGC